ncbi:beta-1,6-N-acetylglucosaminyltransferase [Flavitalea antarctica]
MIAHLILTHKNPRQLEMLIEALDHERFHFYIHVDKKTAIEPFQYLSEKKNVFLIRNRTKVYWAGYGTIQATINGFEEIPLGKYDFVNVISSQDFPIKSPQYIYDFFDRNKGSEFITCESVDDEWKDAAPRVKKYHLINWQIPGKHRIEKLLNLILPPRKYPLDHKIVGRSNWFTLSAAAITYLLEFFRQHPTIPRYYKYCWGADEFIFATTLYNSKFKSDIKDSLTYVDWTQPESPGHPKILTVQDLERLKTTDKLFARKFDMSKDAQVLGILHSWIRRSVLE